MSSSVFAQLVPATKNSADETANTEELNKVNPKKIATPPATKAGEAPAKSEVQKVTIKGGRQSDLDERRLSTASRMVFGREELDRNGDSTIGDVLKRLPGVTIGGRPGRGSGDRKRIS